ncbi:MAG: FAD-binding protein [Pseudomonadota bacterium]
MTIRPAVEAKPDFDAGLVIICAGAAGLVGSLAAVEAGAQPLVLERDAVPRGSTALSAGLVPAAGTRFQRAAGVSDSAAAFAADIRRKARNTNDPTMVALIAGEAGPTVEWLADRHGVPFDLVDDFDYPGHSARRMHGTPSRTGADLIDHLRQAAEASGVDIVCNRKVIDLFAAEDGTVTALAAEAPDGCVDVIGCRALVLACCGYGGNPALLQRYAPQIADALYFGHDGNQGDALQWGRALGAATRDLDAYQGHGAVATPHNILISWAAIMEGGFQVNSDGARFWNEASGYSEAAGHVIAQPGRVAWVIFDERIAATVRQFDDFRQAEAQGAILRSETPASLADELGLPVDQLTETIAAVDGYKAGDAVDPLGRSWNGSQPLTPPYCGVKVTGALFHTQGGLVVDETARVMRPDGTSLLNLWAAGGAAAGVSGSGDAGYLSGNGLLTATVLGRLAGARAAELVGAGR